VTRKSDGSIVMRVAIYARMSTDKQSADSPADQIARCRDFAIGRSRSPRAKPGHVLRITALASPGTTGNPWMANRGR